MDPSSIPLSSPPLVSQSAEHFRLIKNELIGSIGRKQSAFSSGQFSQLLSSAVSSSDPEVLFQVLPCINSIVRDVPEALDTFKTQSEGLITAAEVLINTQSLPMKKVGIRLLESLAENGGVKTWGKLIEIVSKAVTDKKLIIFCSGLLQRYLRTSTEIAIPRDTFSSLLSQLVTVSLNPQNAAQLESVLSVIAFGIQSDLELAKDAVSCEDFLPVVMNSSRSECEGVKLASLRCVTGLIKWDLLTDSKGEGLIQWAISILAQICLSEHTEACEVLGTLVQGKEQAQELLKVQGFIQDFAVVMVKTQAEMVENALEQQAPALAVGLSCLAKAVDTLEENRQILYEREDFMVMVLKLLTSPSLPIRKAACELLFSLSRSTRDLRHTLLSDTVPASLVKLLDESDLELRHLVLKLLINTVLDYQDLEIDITEMVDKVCILVRDDNLETRKFALWTLKNLTYLDKEDVKQEVLKFIPIPDLIEYVRSGEEIVQVQALCILRNLLFKSVQEVEAVLSVCEAELISLLEDIVKKKTKHLVLHAMLAVCNITSGDERHKLLIISSPLMQEILNLCRDEDLELRRAAVDCLISLCWRDGFPVEEERLEMLRGLGVQSLLREARPELDMESIVQGACNNLGQDL